MNLKKIVDVSKDLQNDEFKSFVYEAITKFVYKYQPLYFKQYKGDVSDLAFDFWDEFFRDKKHRNGKVFSEADRFDYDKIGGPNWTASDEKKLAAHLQTYVKHRLIDRSRTFKNDMRYSESKGEGGLSIDYLASVIDEPDFSLEEIRMSPKQIEEGRKIYMAMPDDKKKEFLEEYDILVPKLPKNLKEIFSQIVGSDTSENFETQAQIIEKSKPLYGVEEKVNEILPGVDTVQYILTTKQNGETVKKPAVKFIFADPTEAKSFDRGSLDEVMKSKDMHFHTVSGNKLYYIHDSLSPTKSIVFHSTNSTNLHEILVNSSFRAGRGGGAMLGPGFYCNQHLYQAQKHNYGRYILKAELKNVDKFLFLDVEMYNEFFGKSVETYPELFDAQISDTKLLSEVKACFPPTGTRVSESNRFSRIAHRYREFIAAGFHGLVYYGDFDKESCVAWNLKDVVPLGWSSDDGKTFSSNIEEKHSSVEQSYQYRDQGIIKSKDEEKRSYQRALDLKKRLEGRDDATIKRAIEAQLSKITSPVKRAIRVDAFRKVFPTVEIADAVLPTFKNASELKRYAEGRGIDVTGLSKAQIENAVARDFWNEEHPGEEMPEQVSPMLIHDLTSTGKDNISQNYHSNEWYAQRKINGMRLILALYPDGTVRLTSRSKSVANLRFTELSGRVLGLLDMKSPFEGVTVLDGEVIMPNPEIDLPSGVHTTSTLQSTVSLMHLNKEQSLEVQKQFGSLVFNAFDILKLNGESTEQLPYEQRCDLVATTVQSIKELNPDCSIETVPVVKDYEDAWALFEEFVKNGEEGIILKKRTAPYEQGTRTRNQFKVKAFVTVDAFVTGWVPSSEDRGNAGLIGGFEFSTNYEGRVIPIGAVSNIDQKTRKDATVLDENGNPTLNPEYLNKCAELIGQDFNKKSFRLNSARINEWRDDKTPEECILLPEQVRFNTSVG